MKGMLSAFAVTFQAPALPDSPSGVGLGPLMGKTVVPGGSEYSASVLARSKSIPAPKGRIASILIGLAALTAPSVAHAVYTSNIEGVITSVRVYDNGTVLIRLNNQPASHPVCDANFFAIDNAMDPEIRAMLLSRALIAKTSAEAVNIGYDGEGNCANGYIRLHEIGS